MKKLFLILSLFFLTYFFFPLDSRSVYSYRTDIKNFFSLSTYLYIENENGDYLFINKSSVHSLGITETDFVLEYNDKKIKIKADDVKIEWYQRELFLYVKDVELY